MTSSFFAISSALFFATDFDLRSVPRTSATASFSNFCRSSGVSLETLNVTTKQPHRCEFTVAIMLYPIIDLLLLIFLLLNDASFFIPFTSACDSVLMKPPPPNFGLPIQNRFIACCTLIN